MNHLGKMKKSTGLENTPQTNMQSYWKRNRMSTGAACPLGDFQVKWLEIILQPSREGAVKRKNSLLDPSAAAAAAAKLLQSCPTLCDPIDGSPPGSPVPGILLGKNTGVGCHFLLQCLKVKSEREVAQLCPTLSDPMDCSLPGSSVHGIFQARELEWGAIAFSSN